MVANWPAYVLRWFFFSLKCSQFGTKSLLPHSLWKWENSFKQSNIYFLYNNFPLVLFWEQTSINIWTFKSIFCVWLYFINKCCCNFHTICKKKKKKNSRLFLLLGKVAAIWVEKHQNMLLHKNSFPQKYDLLTCWVIILTEGALEYPRKDKNVIFPGITH